MSAPSCFLGVDPGLGGAIAFYFPAQGVVSVDDMPVVAGDVDGATLAARIAQRRPDLAIVELVASRPGQGVASVFKFGSGFGIGPRRHRGERRSAAPCLAGKMEASLRARRRQGKSRALALRLWPARADLFGRKRDHGRAEAALLARYGAERIVSVGGGQ